LPALVIAVLLVAHGLVHALYLVPAPPARPGAPAWPFDLRTSRVLTHIGAGGAQAVGGLLVLVIVAAYAVAAVTLLGVGPAAWFPGAVVAGSVASLVLLAIAFHPWLVLGIAIDLVLIGAVVLGGWAPPGGA
jgi:hypothetical protein